MTHMSRLTVLRWGRAEYELGPLTGLPDGVRVVDTLGEERDPLEEADVVVVPSVRPVRAEHVSRLTRCRLVLTSTSGFDHVDVTALLAAGIPCARLPLARRDAVVETALGMMLALGRRFGDYRVGAEAGAWDRDQLPRIGAHLLGTVGVIGCGVIGARMVQVVRALGARVLVCDPALSDTIPLDPLLGQADVVTLHCELTPDTRGMIGPRAIAAMRPGAILVNTARGKLVDVDSALLAVRADHLGGLGLDVYPTEPTSLARYTHPRIIVSPHAAGWFPGLGAAIADGVREAVVALLEGRPVPYRVTAPAVP